MIAHFYKEPQPRCQELEPVHRFNNYVKACLIQTFLKPCGSVLDIPCGRGGDLKKYRENNAGSYYGIDIVPERIQEAKLRHKTTKCMFGAVFEVGDFAKVPYMRQTPSSHELRTDHHRLQGLHVRRSDICLRIV
jgi:SAM-dependent methyltransferase